MEHFVDNDLGYLAWVRDPAHADGFVVNSERVPDSAYLVLHRVSCWTITRLQKPCRSWTVEFSKTCSRDRGELERWAARLGGTLTVCGFCMRGGARPAARQTSGTRQEPGPVAPAVADTRPEPAVVVPRSCTVTVRGEVLYWPLLCACCGQPLASSFASSIDRDGQRCIPISPASREVPLCGRCSEHERMIAEASRLAGGEEAAVARPERDRRVQELRSEAAMMRRGECCSGGPPVVFAEYTGDARTLRFGNRTYAGAFTKANADRVIR